MEDPFRLFENRVCCKISKKLRGDPSETLKKIGKIFEKKRKMRFLKQSHSAEKLERGDPLSFLKIQSVAKYQKT